MRPLESVLPESTSVESVTRLKAITATWDNVWKVRELNSEARIANFLGIEPQYHALLATLPQDDFVFLLDKCPSANDTLAEHPRVLAELEALFPAQSADIAKFLGRQSTTFFCKADLLNLKPAIPNKQRLDAIVAFQERVKTLNTRGNGALCVFLPTGTSAVSTPLTESVAELTSDTSFKQLSELSYDEKLTDAEELLYNMATAQLAKPLSSIPGFGRGAAIQELYEAIRDQYAAQFATAAAEESKEEARAAP